MDYAAGVDRTDVAGEVSVVDRGAREIVVFLSGTVDDVLSDQLHSAVDDVTKLEELNGLDHVVVDMHKVTALDHSGISFLHELIQRGHKAGYQVSFSSLCGPAHRAIEGAGWPFMEHSPLTIPAQRSEPT